MNPMMSISARMNNARNFLSALVGVFMFTPPWVLNVFSAFGVFGVSSVCGAFGV